MYHDVERHAGRGLQEKGLVLYPIGAEDEISERFVGDDRLAGTAGLGQVDDCGRVFGRGVLIAREDEVQEQTGRRVAPQRPALRSFRPISESDCFDWGFQARRVRGRSAS
jgi:hypothetical protein